MQDRFTELEIRITHIEDSMAQLSDVLYEQRGLLDKLQQGMDDLRQKVAAGDSATGTNEAADEKPPHY